MGCGQVSAKASPVRSVQGVGQNRCSGQAFTRGILGQKKGGAPPAEDLIPALLVRGSRAVRPVRLRVGTAGRPSNLGVNTWPGDRRMRATDQTRRVDDMRVGAAVRAVRVRRRLTQANLAAIARVSQPTVSRVERGHPGQLSLDAIRAIGAALEIRVILMARWRGGELDRLLNARHAALHESVARHFATLDGWVVKPEVSFSVYGERGVIDMLGWHAATRALLVVELKTEIVDVNELLGTLDRKRRLARSVAGELGWEPSSVSTWLIVMEDRTNRRRIAAHRAMLRNALPDDGRAARRWLSMPAGGIDAMSMWPAARSVRQPGREPPHPFGPGRRMHPKKR